MILFYRTVRPEGAAVMRSRCRQRRIPAVSDKASRASLQAVNGVESSQLADCQRSLERCWNYVLRITIVIRSKKQPYHEEKE